MAALPPTPVKLSKIRRSSKTAQRKRSPAILASPMPADPYLLPPTVLVLSNLRIRSRAHTVPFRKHPPSRAHRSSAYSRSSQPAAFTRCQVLSPQPQQTSRPTRALNYLAPSAAHTSPISLTGRRYESATPLPSPASLALTFHQFQLPLTMFQIGVPSPAASYSRFLLSPAPLLNLCRSAHQLSLWRTPK